MVVGKPHVVPVVWPKRHNVNDQVFRSLTFRNFPGEVRNKIYGLLGLETTIWCNANAIIQAGNVPTPYTEVPGFSKMVRRVPLSDYPCAIAQIYNWEITETNKVIREECLQYLTMGDTVWVYNGSDIPFDIARAIPATFTPNIKRIYVSGIDPAIHVDYPALPALETVEILTDRMHWNPPDEDNITGNFANSGAGMINSSNGLINHTREISNFLDTTSPPKRVRIIISTMMLIRIKSRLMPYLYGSLDMPSMNDQDVSFVSITFAVIISAANVVIGTQIRLLHGRGGGPLS